AGNSLFRGVAEGMTLEPWLDHVWRAEHAVLSAETAYLGSCAGLAENLLCGVTTVMDMYWYPEEVVKAAGDLGMRVAIGPILFDPVGMDKATADQRMDMAHAFFAAHGADAHLIPTVMAHGAYTVGPDMLREGHALAEEKGALFCTHAAETRVEQATIQERYGTSVIRHLDALGTLTPRTVLAHCVHVDEGERDILAERGVAVSHNPASNLKLGAGIAPVPELMAKGVRISLGTDGPISGNDLDMWKALRYGAVLHNGRLEDPTAILPRQAFAMATLAGADALGMAGEIGSLEAGKRADFILVRADGVHAAPIFDALEHLVYAAAKSDVTDVFVGGEHVVADGAATRVDLAEIIAGVHALQPAIAAAVAD
ncbi:MAG: amidohydrolase family protein, partial [Caulobacterales bacterium]|nr:amidohydrolase family protein [Caulobacterales bacterium]